MLHNYLIIALRNLRKQSFYSSINILGLSVGLACFLFMALFISDELSYDRISPKAAQIYRSDVAIRLNDSDFNTALMSPTGAAGIKASIPEVEDAFRFRTSGNWFVKRKGQETSYKEEHVVYADPNCFSFWELPLIAGDAATCLKSPNTLVMDQSTAKKLFGDENPIGQVVKLDNKKDYEVTGVYADLPENNHFHFNIMLTMVDLEEAKRNEWLGQINFNTYLKTTPGTDPKILQEKVNALFVEKAIPEVQQYMNLNMDDFNKAGNRLEATLMPLTDIHLHSDKLGDLEANGDIKYVYIFSAIAIFILLLACINFMNLATARSANRAKEVGMRKVMGAVRQQLIGQFIAEAMLIATISSLLAFGIVYFMLSPFNELANKHLTADDVFAPLIWLIMSIITIVVGFLAGSYPAFYLSRFRPAETLKGKLNLGFKSSGIRSTLVVVQFTISIIMMIGTAIVFDQLHYIQNKKLGFDKSQVLMIHDAWILGDQAQTFKQEVVRDSRIISGTASSYLPVSTDNNNSLYYVGKTMESKNSQVLTTFYIDTDYVSTLGLEMADGRNFSHDFLSDSNAIMINEAAVRHLNLEKPLDSYLTSMEGEDNHPLNLQIIGVIKDFHYRSLKDRIEPLVFRLGKSNGYISFKIAGDNPDETVHYVRGIWEKMATGQPFAYSFMDERFSLMYQSEKQIGKIFTTFAFMAIFIACLGLFGLASFTAEQRRKEIGIRKVLGASVMQIVNKLSLNFIKLVLISFALATPVSYLAMNQWLSEFAYRTDLHVTVFLMAGLTAIAIAILTMGLQSWKVARANPVSSLRNE